MFAVAAPRLSRIGGLRPPRLGVILAEGGVGVVHAARDEAGRPLAVKTLRPCHAGDAAMARSLVQEATYARSVNHPNVVRVYEGGELPDGRPYLVMERVEGESLGAMVRARGPLPVEEALRLGDQLLAGLGALHRAGLVHRDLQPENVLITSAGVVKLIDLGFARPTGVDHGDGLTPDSAGALVGTAAFMAPEQALRGRAVTPQSDIFAAALVVYYALTGRSPFPATTDAERLVAVVRRRPVPVRRVRRDVPPRLAAVIARALEKHPDCRFESAGAMRLALAA